MAKNNREDMEQKIREMISGNNPMETVGELTKMDDSDAKEMLQFLEAMIDEAENEDGALDGVDMNDKYAVFRRRLTIESLIAQPDVMDEINGVDYAANLETILAVGINEAEYQDWKKEYLDAKYEEEKGKNFKRCSFVVAGYGNYIQTVPENQIGCVQNWVDGNGSAFFGGVEDATEEDVKIAIGRVREQAYKR